MKTKENCDDGDHDYLRWYGNSEDFEALCVCGDI